MPVTVRIPLVLARLTGGSREVQVQASTIRGMIDELEARFPGIKTRLCDAQGELRTVLNLYVNEKDVRSLGGMDTPLDGGDFVSIVPMVAGG